MDILLHGKLFPNKYHNELYRGEKIKAQREPKPGEF